jgi:hypothetical protein
MSKGGRDRLAGISGNEDEDVTGMNLWCRIEEKKRAGE